LEELETINTKNKTRFSAVNLASRQFLCLNPECHDLPVRDAQEQCSLLREVKECPWASDIENLPPGIPPVLTQNLLKSLGRQHRLCPYYLARKVSKGCKVVVVPYPYVFNNKVRMGVGLEITGKTLIMDEGHNLDKVGQETLSDTLTEFVLDAAREELKSVKGPTRHMEMMARYLRQNISVRPMLKSAEQLQRDLELLLGSDLLLIVDQYSDLVNRVRAHKTQRGDPPISYLNGVMTFLELIAQSVKSKYVALYHTNRRGNNALDYRCLDASLVLQPVVAEANGAIIMSGTISPLDLFAEIVGLPDAEKKAYPSIQNPKNIRMVVNAGVTSTYRERTDEMIMRIGRSIASDIAGIPNGVLIFFPQRRFMDTCLDMWGVNRIIEVKQGRLYLGGKPLYSEGRRPNDNRDTVSRYKRSAVQTSGAVLCCVFRGRNSEGSNFPDEQARGIFLVGVPYANYGDPIVKAQINYYNRRRQGLGQQWYTMDAFRASNQALGRGIRGKEDWCHYWLMDRRYASNMTLISKWAQGNGPEYV
jgi:Rad3-related DNA helicase